MEGERTTRYDTTDFEGSMLFVGRNIYFMPENDDDRWCRHGHGTEAGPCDHCLADLRRFPVKDDA